MKLETTRQPVIILGMHRSGTSMVSELLDQLGLFVGQELQDDHESTFFLDLNTEIMSRVSASWDYPRPVLDFFACEEAVRMTADALTADLASRSIKKFLHKGTLATFDKPWGWKDPRYRVHAAAVAAIVPSGQAGLHRSQRNRCGQKPAGPRKKVAETPHRAF